MVLFAVVGVVASAFFIRRGDIKNWSSLNAPTKMNDITIFGTTAIFIIFAILEHFGIVVLK